MIECLVTFGTPEYFHRQFILGSSAVRTGVVTRHMPWTPAKIARAGFADFAPDIDIRKRGAGYWAWKPFIISSALEGMKEGSCLLYCDVGRKFPFRILNSPLDLFEKWMDENNQSFLPGVSIPWHGPMERWTKRDAFILTGTDTAEYRNSSQIQASFSLWRRTPQALSFINRWQEWCADSRKISDESGTCGQPELRKYVEHRHDQALLSLLCIREKLKAFDVGNEMPSFDEKDPCSIARSHGVKELAIPLWLRLLQLGFEGLEKAARKVSGRDVFV